MSKDADKFEAAWLESPASRRHKRLSERYGAQYKNGWMYGFKLAVDAESELLYLDGAESDDEHFDWEGHKEGIISPLAKEVARQIKEEFDAKVTQKMKEAKK
jgi:hypothetical protein